MKKAFLTGGFFIVLIFWERPNKKEERFDNPYHYTMKSMNLFFFSLINNLVTLGNQ
jgi:hypothetical protein